MNERIRELALQAGEYANSVYTPPVRSKTPGKIWEDGHIDWHELYNEKFAELIVGECIEKITTYDLTPGHSAKWEDIYDIHARLLQDLGEELREHFGVK